MASVKYGCVFSMGCSRDTGMCQNMLRLVLCGSAMPMLSCINFIQTIHVAFQLQIETNPHFDPIFNAFDDNPQTANQDALFVNAL